MARRPGAPGGIWQRFSGAVAEAIRLFREQMQNKIDNDRICIDAIDREILALLNRRCELAGAIGIAKRQAGIAFVQTSCEEQILADLAAESHGPLGADEIAGIWNEIFAANRLMQGKPLVGYLGPRGTYCEDAALREFGSVSLLTPFESTDAAFEAVSTGVIECAVVPVENSTEGVVARTLDLIGEARLPVTGEVVIPIAHCLLTNATELAEIECVLGHPQALSQCRRWLDRNLPGVERRASPSNARAASAAASTPGYAAIAGERAARLYDLGLMKRSIQDEPINTTRFLVIGGQRKPPTGNDATLILAELKNQPGSLSRLLAPLQQRGISTLRIQSRPVRTTLWTYRFFLEFAGHQLDEAVSRALADMGQESSSLFVAGSYPSRQAGVLEVFA
ncbi:prephenate dehydratase [Paraburkholderia dipogonis]|uniref:prephenate dehydratase n=1 Tax=Paraburkholderia dipogonis TaxID=1211383 RepID=UPI003622C231